MPIHPTAIVEDGARLADGVEVGPFCIVSKDAELGEGVRLLSHVVIAGKTKIGARTIVHPHAVLGGEAQIFNNNAPQARLEIGSGNVFREGVSISLGSAKGHNLTKIGNNCFFMAGSHVGHDGVVGDNVTLANVVSIAGHCELGDGAIFGGAAQMQQFGRVGKGAFVSGLSGVARDIIPYSMAIGLHALHGGLNLVGLRRRGLPREHIHAMRAAYRMIFSEGAKIADGARAAAARWPDVPQVLEMTDFILAPAKRAIAPARDRSAADESE